jgi:hypothetical protein
MNERLKQRRACPCRPATLAAWVVLGGCALFASACGYMLVGSGALPPGIRTIRVPVFENRTTRFELDIKLTRAVINELVSRGKIQVTTDADKADAVLEGRILDFIVNPIAFSNQRTADRYDVLVVVDVTLKETKSGRVIYANPSFNYKTDYQVPQGQDFESSETEALDNLAKLFARGLIVAILEGF